MLGLIGDDLYASHGTAKRKGRGGQAKERVLSALRRDIYIKRSDWVIAKAYQEAVSFADEVGFTVISCLLTAVFSGLLLLPEAIKNKAAITREIRGAFRPAPFWCMVAIGITTHTGNFLHLKAAAALPASVQFPIVSGGVVVFSALISAKIFKETISKKEWLCVAGACLSTLLFAF